jgi:UDP-2-acetamido-2-deoxy-ribo-hexuluronate aminotransferase
MGQEVDLLEHELCKFTGAEHCICCANGTDALVLSLMAAGIGRGDEVIVPAFTFVATAEAVSLVGATPIFADIDQLDYCLSISSAKKLISEKTKAIIPVSIFGQTSDMVAFNKLAEEHGLLLIEDAAQSFGAIYQGENSCNLSEIGCTSFFPAKPLGCYGDGGAVFTSNTELADKIKSMRVHGQTRRYVHEYVGLNSRLDTMQAAVLLVKLKHYAREIVKRQDASQFYTRLLSELSAEKITLPFVHPERKSVWAQYSVQVENRDLVIEKLKQKGIPTAVHYPVPLNEQPVYKDIKSAPCPVAQSLSRKILSLPMSAFLTEKQQFYIADSLIEIISGSNL